MINAIFPTVGFYFIPVLFFFFVDITFDITTLYRPIDGQGEQILAAYQVLI